MLDFAWYALEFSGRIGLVGGAYSHFGSASVSVKALMIWLFAVSVWSWLLAEVVARSQSGGRERMVTNSLIVGVGTALFYLISHPLLLPVLLAELGIRRPLLFDSWYGQRLSIASVAVIAILHASWLLLLLVLRGRRLGHGGVKHA